MSFEYNAKPKAGEGPALVAHGTPDAAWDFLADVSHLAIVQAKLLDHCIANQDKPGAAFAVRRLRACVRTIGSTLKEEVR